MKKVALITLHGMGKIKSHYFAELAAGLAQRLGNEWHDVAFRNVQYQPELQGPQDALWEAMSECEDNQLDGVKLREFLLYGFGDAGSLEHSLRTKEKKTYLLTQAKIFQTLSAALNDAQGNINMPVVLIAQSLGCQVISNYLWDAEHGSNLFAPEFSAYRQGEPISDFHRLTSCVQLVTTGCNIPLFVSGLAERVCFKPPTAAFRWDNYYDRDDVLGWPLCQLGPTYNIVHDHPINAGGALSSWNLASHGEYWSDANVLDPLAQTLRDLM